VLKKCKTSKACHLAHRSIQTYCLQHYYIIKYINGIIKASHFITVSYDDDISLCFSGIKQTFLNTILSSKNQSLGL